MTPDTLATSRWTTRLKTFEVRSAPLLLLPNSVAVFV